MKTTNETVYVIRDAAAEYLRANGAWTPASNEAAEYETREEADQALSDCGRSTARVLSREIERD